MTCSGQMRVAIALVIVAAIAPNEGHAQRGTGAKREGINAPAVAAGINAMNNPYRMLENWPHLGDIKLGAAIGITPDGKGGVWLQHRSVPAILHIDASGSIVKRFEV